MVLLCLASFYAHTEPDGTVPAPNGRSGKKFSTYIRVELLTSGTLQTGGLKDLKGRHTSFHSKTLKVQHAEGIGADAFWNERFEWEYTKDDLACLRCVSHYFCFTVYLEYSMSIFRALLIDHSLFFNRFVLMEDEIGIDDTIVVACVRLRDVVRDQWALVRMMDPHGKNSGATVLVRFRSSDA